MNSLIDSAFPRLHSRASGLLPNAPGVPHSEGWASDLILSAMLGSFIGLVGAFLVSRIIRGLGIHDRIPLGGGRLALVGSVMGAVCFAAISLVAN